MIDLMTGSPATYSAFYDQLQSLQAEVIHAENAVQLAQQRPVQATHTGMYARRFLPPACIPRSDDVHTHAINPRLLITTNAFKQQNPSPALALSAMS